MKHNQDLQVGNKDPAGCNVLQMRIYGLLYLLRNFVSVDVIPHSDIQSLKNSLVHTEGERRGEGEHEPIKSCTMQHYYSPQSCELWYVPCCSILRILAANSFILTYPLSSEAALNTCNTCSSVASFLRNAKRCPLASTLLLE